MLDSPEALTLLREIAASMRDIRNALVTPSSVDMPGAADLLRVIQSTIGDRVFAGTELVTHALLPQAADLLAALTTAAGAANPRKLGKLLRSLEGRDVGGIMVRRVGNDRDGVLWQVVRVCGFETRKPT